MLILHECQHTVIFLPPVPIFLLHECHCVTQWVCHFPPNHVWVPPVTTQRHTTLLAASGSLRNLPPPAAGWEQWKVGGAATGEMCCCQDWLIAVAPQGFEQTQEQWQWQWQEVVCHSQLLFRCMLFGFFGQKGDVLLMWEVPILGMFECLDGLFLPLPTGQEAAPTAQCQE